jgi:hypothetical protein
MLVINEPGLRSGSGSNPNEARIESGWMVLLIARVEDSGIISILAYGYIGCNSCSRMTGFKVPMRRIGWGSKKELISFV